MNKFLTLLTILVFTSAHTTFAGWALVVNNSGTIDTPPSTYTLSGTITDTPATGSTFTIDSVAYDSTDSPISISGLSSSTQSIAFTADDDELGNCTGTGLTGTADTGPWAVDMSSANVSNLACTVSAAATATYFGSAAEPVAGDSTSGTHTAYVMDKAATTSGNITQIEIYSVTATVLDFAVFSKSASDFAPDHTATNLTLVAGLNTFVSGTDYTAASLPIVIGEYIGHSTAGTIGKLTTGGSGYWYNTTAGLIDAGTTATYSLSGSTTNELQIRVTIE